MNSSNKYRLRPLNKSAPPYKMLAYIVEFLGTFLFLSVVLATSQPILIALGLLVAMLLGGSVSGGHFNPAISAMFWMKGALAGTDAAAYILAQLLGGMGALAAYKGFGVHA